MKPNEISKHIYSIRVSLGLLKSMFEKLHDELMFIELHICDIEVSNEENVRKNQSQKIPFEETNIEGAETSENIGAAMGAYKQAKMEKGE